MKVFLMVIMSMVIHTFTIAQPPSSSQVQDRLPKGTIIHGNISYNNDTSKNIC